jgi:hypothetical protein
MPTVMQPWTWEIGLRHQGVLVSAMRGCDLAPRHDPSKVAQRLLRGAVLTPHCGRFANPKTYIAVEPDETKWWEHVKTFITSWDHYPNHYVVHFIHAVEIVGYLGPPIDPVYSDRWRALYYSACKILHLNPETPLQLDERLNADEATFYARQQHELHRDN